jgi:cell division protein FtsW
MIEREPDLGTAAVILAIAAVMLFLGGVSKRSLVVGVLIGALGVFFLVTLEPYRVERILHHSERWNVGMVDDLGYQTTQSETAMAGGGFWGVGIGSGRAKHMLPAATTDFILATIGEETGLLGALGVLAMLGVLAWRLMHLGMRLSDRFGQLVLFGTAAWLGVQSSVNVMMANGTLPAIGIPLPLISSGGSSLIAIWGCLGICQSLVRNQTKAQGRSV